MNYKLLESSGLRVSELCLGTMTFGIEWGYGAEFSEAEKQFRLFSESGGNFIDTANRYTEGTSERFIGELIHGDRDKYVIATKYTLFDRRDDINASGNHRKNMIRSLHGSLARLKTDYIDVLYVHIWDFTTPVEEILRGMDDLIRSGKVLYCAISDTPAWIVAKSQEVSQFRGYTPLLALQSEYSLIQRTHERDLLPMCTHYGMTLTAWAPLAGGALSGKYLTGKESGRVPEHSLRRSERAQRIVKEVAAVAQEVGCETVHVALNWLRSKSAHVIPVIGARTAHQLKQSIECLQHTLTQEHLDRLDKVSEIDKGFPHDFLESEAVKDVVFGGQRSRINSERLPK